MKIHSQKLTLNEINFLITNLKNYQKENLNPNISHFFVYEGVAISIYKTNTVLFQGQNVDYVVSIFLQRKNHELTEQIIDVSEIDNEPDKVNDMVQIGCDEVGVGDYFGGIVTAAAVVAPEDIELLKKETIRDSKTINDTKISEIYNRISEHTQFTYVSVNAEEYNELFNKFKNAHIIKTYLHNKTLEQLFDKYQLNPENVKVILDQYASEKNYEEYLDAINPPKRIKIDIFETKAESKYLSVALASIIARYYFLKQIEEIRDLTNLPIFLGSSNPQVKVIARKVFEKYGINDFKKFVKIHFKTTDQVLNWSKKKNKTNDDE